MVSTPSRRPIIQVVANRDYRLLWAAGLFAMLARWIALLVSGYLVLQLTDSIFLTQMAGVAFLLPQTFMGVFTGVIADAYDRRTVIGVAFIANALLFALLAALVFSETATAPRILAINFLIGVSFNVDMVVRRTFVIDIVGKEMLTSAVSLDTVNMTVAVLVGPVLAGVLLEVIPESGFANVASIYSLIASCYVAAVVLIIRVKPQLRQKANISLKQTLAFISEGFREVSRSRAMVGVLGVTVLMNLAFFPFMPMIPVFAEKVLEVEPAAMGLLGGASGVGSLFGATFIAARGNIQRKSVYYYGGTLLSLGILAVFSLSTSFPISLALLMLAGATTSGFGTMQATLILISARDEMRGRAMGILSLAIGAEPFGGIMLGVLAERLGPSQAVGLMTVSGLAMTAVWTYFAKEMRRL